MNEAVTKEIPGETLADFRSVAIIGVGLIGGSIAAAVRKRSPQVRVIGVGRTQTRLDAAQAAGLITESTTAIDRLDDVDVIVACTPVDRIADDLLQASRGVSANGILTDAGSVKAPLCRQMSGIPQFVGSHPLAGSANSGWEHAEADLFCNRTCVITPIDQCDHQAVRQTHRFWERIGMTTVELTPEDHDKAVSQVSHIPHVGAAAVARVVEPPFESLVASGFRDTTRVAAGDPYLWTTILEANAQAISHDLGRLIQDLGALRDAVNTGNRSAITEWFAAAAAIRGRVADS